jgi:hypothetical protein
VCGFDSVLVSFHHVLPVPGQDIDIKHLTTGSQIEERWQWPIFLIDMLLLKRMLRKLDVRPKAIVLRQLLWTGESSLDITKCQSLSQIFCHKVCRNSDTPRTSWSGLTY